MNNERKEKTLSAIYQFMLEIYHKFRNLSMKVNLSGDGGILHNIYINTYTIYTIHIYIHIYTYIYLELNLINYKFNNFEEMNTV